MIMVAGATGLLGSEICRLLCESDKDVRALVRDSSDPDKVTRLEEMRASVARGDIKDRSSLDAACHGVDTVISTVSSTLSRQEGDSIESVDEQGQINLIEAARDAGVVRFILVSFNEMAEDFALQDAKRSAEHAVKRSGMRYTILQPTFFTEVWLSPALGFDAGNGNAQIYGSGENKISWISYKDVAKFAVAALDNPKAENAVIQLGGPQAISPLEAVSLFEQASGKKFEVQHVPEEALRQQKDSASDTLQRSFAGLMLSYAKGDVIDMSSTLRDFPMRLSSVEDYAKRVTATNS